MHHVRIQRSSLPALQLRWDFILLHFFANSNLGVFLCNFRSFCLASNSQESSVMYINIFQYWKATPWMQKSAFTFWSYFFSFNSSCRYPEMFSSVFPEPNPTPDGLLTAFWPRPPAAARRRAVQVAPGRRSRHQRNKNVSDHKLCGKQKHEFLLRSLQPGQFWKKCLF